jgi:hypothetical protein
MIDPQIKIRFTVLYWAVGSTIGLVIALLANMLTISHQLGQIQGSLTVLINHATLH